MAIQVQRNECMHSLTPFPCQLIFLFQGGENLFVHPRGRLEGVLRAAQEELIPEPDASVNMVVQRIARQELLLIKPTSDTASLKRIVQATGKRFVLVAV